MGYLGRPGNLGSAWRVLVLSLDGAQEVCEMRRADATPQHELRENEETRVPQVQAPCGHGNPDGSRKALRSNGLHSGPRNLFCGNELKVGFDSSRGASRLDAI